ncbi:universal stress protein [Pseudofrankia asymbiotica]|uniref:UspA domain-containing protein n=1 Tax=Pseudofrankia asymbiotica TaxID=1834516 RepID=A0A1V2IB27_9ACTN|nr:universal stress protein [Pseudofrankia asymbiotica]ONH28856.1 hypothetical protein BL253_18675 [Pseudofrankia asymbiotica]
MDDRVRILVGVDGSSSSETALRWALREAALWAATASPSGTDHREKSIVTVLLAWTADHMPSGGPHTARVFDHDGLVRMGTQTLERSVRRVGASVPGVELRQLIVHDEPVAALVRAARDADVIVVGERGLGPLRRDTAGSISQGLADHAPVPVVITRPPAMEGTGGNMNAGCLTCDRRPVVVGVDSSDSSLCALRWAARAAAVRRVPLRVVHAWGCDEPVGGDAHATSGGARTRRAREIIDYAVTFGLDDDIDVTLEPIVSSEPAIRALLRASRDAQLLVLGSRGLSGMARLTYGSVSHQCLLFGTSDLAVVRTLHRLPS